MIPLPAQPAGTPWPTAAWPTAALDPAVDAAQLARLLDEAFRPETEARMGKTHALLAIQRGAIVAERYGEESGPDSTLISWSMAKSMLHAVVGVLVRDGKLDIHAPADVPAWNAPDDPRRAVTLDQLLRMSSGLLWNEDYVDDGISNVIEMLFKSGKPDVAGYAAAQPLAVSPDDAWLYSSGSSNIVSAIVARTLGGGEPAYAEMIRRELFEPLGMGSATLRFDEAGTWIGSSYVFATARDFARFGLLYLRDGIWEGERLLPEGWVDYARTPTPRSAGFYGSHWWLNPQDSLGTFFASGYAAQRILVFPALDMVLVRLGVSGMDQYVAVEDHLSSLIRCFSADRPWQGLLPRQ